MRIFPGRFLFITMEKTTILTKRQRKLNDIKSWLSKPENVLALLFFIIFTVLLMYPLFAVIRSSITLGLKDSKMYSAIFGQKLKKGDISFNNFSMLLGGKYTAEYSRGFFWKPLLNSVELALFATVFSLIVGGTIAFLITRTDLKGKKFISSVMMFPFIMPSWTLALVWRNLFQNTQTGAGICGFFEAMTGICVPSWFVFGLFPCVIVLGLHNAPLAYIMLGGVLRNMDANLEEAATILKAGRMRIMTKITIPMLLPTILFVFLMGFSGGLATFAIPNFVGSPGNFFVLSTMLTSLYSSPYSGQAYVMTIILMIFGMGFLIMNQKIVGNRKSFTTVTGKSGQVSYIKLRKANLPVSVFLIIAVGLVAVFPIVSFALESLVVNPGDYSRLTLKFWTSKENLSDFFRNVGCGILFNKTVWGAMWNSIKLATTVAVVVGTSGFLIGYCVSKKRNSKLANIVSAYSFFPYLIPTMAFGAIWLAVSSKILILRGSMLLLVIVGGIKYLPISARNDTNAMMQLSGEIEEASVLVGASWLKRVSRILFPIQKSSFISGYLLPFINCMRELSLFILLCDSGSLITTLLVYYDEASVFQMSNGVNLMIVLFVLFINYIVNKLTGASIDKGIGGGN